MNFKAAGRSVSSESSLHSFGIVSGSCTHRYLQKTNQSIFKKIKRKSSRAQKV